MKHQLGASESLGGKRHCALPATLEYNQGEDLVRKLCSASPLTTDDLKSALSIAPKAATIHDLHGRTPLFHAVKRKLSANIIQMLFQAYPEAAVLADFCGQSPLHLLFHTSYCPSLLESMLQAEPSLAIHRPNTFAGKMLLHHVCSCWQAVVNDLDNEVTLRAWTKLMLTVRAANQFYYNPGPEKIPELHMALELNLPASVVLQCCRFYPWQVSQRMARQDLMLPLHYVLTQERTGSAFGTVIRELLDIHPESACTRYRGSYPLHLALMQGLHWNDGVRDLVFACHDALHTPSESGLCPFQLAATLPNSDLVTIFGLLRERPILHSKAKQSIRVEVKEC